MSNNSITQSNALVNYNPGNASLLEMRADPQRFPRVNSMPVEMAVFEMSKIVSQAFLYKGQAADPTNIQFISSALVQELLDDPTYGAANISFAEIQVVVKRAILGSDVFGISVASLYRIIIDFVKGEGHINHKKVCDQQRAIEEKRVKDSGISPMIQAYTGEFLRNNKVKK